MKYDLLHHDMAHDRCNCYFSFWAIFYPFTPTNSQKNRNFEKMKRKPGDITVYMCVPKIMVRLCAVCEILCVTDGRTDGCTDRKSDRGGCPT